MDHPSDKQLWYEQIDLLIESITRFTVSTPISTIRKVFFPSLVCVCVVLKVFVPIRRSKI
jgi:hypothetical protein